MAVSQLRIFLGWNQIELGMTEDEIVKKWYNQCEKKKN